jgi:hypothetical protein
MGQLYGISIFSLSITLVAFFQASPLQGQNTPLYAYDQIIVRFQDHVNERIKKSVDPAPAFIDFYDEYLNHLSKTHQCIKVVRLAGPKSKNALYVLKFKNKDVTDVLLKDYNRSSLIKYAEPDFTGNTGGIKATMAVPNDTYYGSRQWSLKNSGRCLGYKYRKCCHSCSNYRYRMQVRSSGSRWKNLAKHE